MSSARQDRPWAQRPAPERCRPRPAVWSPDNADQLGLYAEGIPEGVDPIIEPDSDLFQPFVDIAAVANVDISDLE